VRRATAAIALLALPEAVARLRDAGGGRKRSSPLYDYDSWPRDKPRAPIQRGRSEGEWDRYRVKGGKVNRRFRRSYLR